MEHLDKVVRVNENTMGNKEEVENDDGGCGVEEISNNELCYMDKLPSEVLMEILSYLDVKQLVKFRLVNSRWNQISCLLLQDKAKNDRQSKLIVQLKKDSYEQYLECTTVINKPFESFIECFSPSTANKSSDRRPRPFPFSCFYIKNPSYMSESQMIQLASNFGHHIKSLILKIKREDCENFEKLWKLLLQFAPHIQHLGIHGTPWLNSVHLFDSDSDSNATSSSNSNTDKSTYCEISLCENINNFSVKSQNKNNNQKQNNNNSFLNNLKTMEVTNICWYGDFNIFMEGLLNHTPNIQQVLPSLSDFCRTIELQDLDIWQSLEKAHLLKKLTITSLQKTPKKCQTPLELMKNLRLEYLHIDFTWHYESVENEEKAIASYAYYAVKSSQDTLLKLKISNLTTQVISRCIRDIKCLPNIRQLKIKIKSGRTETGNLMCQMSQLCPNTTSLDLNSLYGDFSEVAPILWTRFKSLKSLKFTIYADDAKNSGRALDSAFSGYSTESIERIQTKLEEEISMEEAREGEQQNPSILDLKYLSRLELEFVLAKRSIAMEQEESILRQSLFTKILPQHIRESPTSILYRYLINN